MLITSSCTYIFEYGSWLTACLVSTDQHHWPMQIRYSFLDVHHVTHHFYEHSLNVTHRLNKIELYQAFIPQHSSFTRHSYWGPWLDYLTWLESTAQCQHDTVTFIRHRNAHSSNRNMCSTVFSNQSTQIHNTTSFVNEIWLPTVVGNKNNAKDKFHFVAIFPPRLRDMNALYSKLT